MGKCIKTRMCPTIEDAIKVNANPIKSIYHQNMNVQSAKKVKTDGWHETIRK